MPFASPGRSLRAARHRTLKLLLEILHEGGKHVCFIIRRGAVARGVCCLCLAHLTNPTCNWLTAGGRSFQAAGH
jgi:hypothetical protein